MVCKVASPVLDYLYGGADQTGDHAGRLVCHIYAQLILRGDQSYDLDLIQTDTDFARTELRHHYR